MKFVAFTVGVCAFVYGPMSAYPCSPRWVNDESGIGVNGTIRTMATSTDGQVLYAGGEFTAVGGVPAENVARFDGRSWTAMGSGLNGRVWALAICDLGAGSALYAGGDFTASGGNTLDHIARWDGTTWQSVGSGTDGGVYALATYTSGGVPVLVAAGQFSDAGGNPAQNVAKYDGSSWSSLGSGLTGSPVAFGRALAVFDHGSGPELYAAGRFTSPAANIARWNGTTWSAIGTGTSGTVNTLAVWNDGTANALYVGGFFTSAGDIANATRIARWNGTQWSALDEGLRDEPVNALAVFNDGNGAALYAGGQFTTAGGVQARRIAKWNGSAWSSLGEGLIDDTSDPCWCDELCGCDPKPAVAYALASYMGSLYVSGDFAQLGACTSPTNLARWTCQPTGTVAPDFDLDRSVDVDDFNIFVSCATGPVQGSITPCCQAADLNDDGYIDMVDFAVLQRCLTIIPDSTPEPGCEG